MHFRWMFFAVLVGEVCVPAFGGPAVVLPFRPAIVEYSHALDRIIATEHAPFRLHINNPAQHTDIAVTLGESPLALAVSRDGRYAAVAGSNRAWYINLVSATVERTFTLTAQTDSLLVDSEWLYAFAGTTASGIRLSTGSVVTSTLPRGTPDVQWHPSGTSAWVSRSNGVWKLRIQEGAVESGPWKNPFQCEFNSAGAASPDGLRLYVSCGMAESETMALSDPIYGASGLFQTANWIRPALSETLHRVAMAYWSHGHSDVIRLFDLQHLRQTGAFSLSRFSSASGSHVLQTKGLFFSGSGTVLHVVGTVPPEAGVLNGNVIQSFDFNQQPVCGSARTTPIELSGAPTMYFDLLTAVGPDCIARGSSPDSWIQIASNLESGSSGVMQFHATANEGTASRAGSITFGTTQVTVTQQPQTLPDTRSIRPLGVPATSAAYSRQLNRLVVTSELLQRVQIIDPATGSSKTVQLERAPTSIGLSPDGARAAIGQNGRISVIDLQTAMVERNIATDSPNSVALSSNGFIYSVGAPTSFPDDGETVLYSISPTGGSGVSSIAIRRPAPTGFARHPEPSRFYSYTYAGVLRHSVRPDGGLNLLGTNIPLASCGQLWFSEGGSRGFTRCGNVFQSSSDSQVDGQILGPLGAAAELLTWLDNSQAKGLTAAIVSSRPTYLRLFNSNRQQTAEVSLGSIDGAQTAGSLVFWNKDSSKLIVVSSYAPPNAFVPTTAWAYEVVDASQFSGCSVTFNPSTVSLTANGGPGTIAVNAPATCQWTAATTASWISIPSPAMQVGSGTIAYTVAGNSAGTARSGSITVGGASVMVLQAAGGGLTLSPGATTRFAAAGGGSAVSLETAVPGASWTVQSTVPWIMFPAGNSVTGSGSGLVQFLVLAHTGAIPRSGAIRAGGQEVKIYQSGTDPGLRFVPVPPCRIADTREGFGFSGAFGPPASTERTFPIPQSNCGIPAEARAYSFNVTAVPALPLAFLTIYPAGSPRPLVSTLNSFDATIKANAAIVPAGAGGGVTVFVSHYSHVVLDINGYFIPAEQASPVQPSLSYKPVASCRLLDTRLTTPLAAGETRLLPLRTTLNACGSIAASARAYQLNVTLVPRASKVSFLTMWPSGNARPHVSTLNSERGWVAANAAIVPAGADGGVQVYVTDPADIVIDLLGTFGPEVGGESAYHFYPVAPCRAVDTRNETTGLYSAPALTGGQARAFPLAGAGCGLIADANVPVSYVLNATVVPRGPLAYLTLYEGRPGEMPPLVSTLNAFQGEVSSNMAVVPGVTAFATSMTDLIVDVSGYFRVP